MTVAAVRLRRARWPLAGVLALVVAMFLLGFPLRTYVEQRASLSAARQTAAQLAAQNRSLQVEAAQLQKPAEIEQLARERYGLVRPGQEEYAILPAPGAGSAAGSTASTARPSASGSGSSADTGTGTVAGDVRSAGAGAAPVAGPAGGGSLWSRFVRQLEFWR